METTNDCNRYGLATMIGWNILLVILVMMVSTVKGISLSYIFDDGTGGVGMSIFLLIWSLIWYGIGYKSRKDFVTTRNVYREQVPLLEHEQFNKAYRDHYIAQYRSYLEALYSFPLEQFKLLI